jgi:hypothetical protein
MQALEGEEEAPVERQYAPRWVWWTLLAGAVVLVAWAYFLFGFRSEPSARGRVGALLSLWSGGALGSAFFGVLAAAGLVRRARWAPRLGLVASVLMILTVVGAIAGIPAAIGIASNRSSHRT